MQDVTPSLVPLAEDFPDPIDRLPVCLGDRIQHGDFCVDGQFEHYACGIQEQDGAPGDLIVLDA
jgi:hypothetical protein